MKSNYSRIMARLGRIYGLLETLETLPEYNGCATIIRRARIALQNAISDLSEEDNASVISKKVVRIIQFVAELFALLAIGRLKDYFNFCTQPILYRCKYRHEYSYQVRQKA